MSPSALLTDGLIAVAGEALTHWDLAGQTPQLVKHRENAVFRVPLAGGGHAALRLHRPGYREPEALLAELTFLEQLHRGGLRVPAPLPSRNSGLLVELRTGPGELPRYASLLTWLEGTPLGESGRPLHMTGREVDRAFSGIGEATARLHEIADRWAVGSDIPRPRWNVDGLVGEAPVWGCFWDCPGLDEEHMSFFSRLRERLLEDLHAFAANNADYGIIHADLVRENILIDNGRIAFIDFDDFGHGFRMFELATTLLKNQDEPEYDLIERALIGGYRRVRSLADIEIAALPMFLVLRSLTYIGWSAARRNEHGMKERFDRMIRQSRRLADRYMNRS